MGRTPDASRLGKHSALEGSSEGMSPFEPSQKWCSAWLRDGVEITLGTELDPPFSLSNPLFSLRLVVGPDPTTIDYQVVSVHVTAVVRSEVQGRIGDIARES